MKKIFLALFLINLLLTSKPPFIYAQNVYYARVLSDNVYFYNSKDESSKQFILEKTYFVELLSNANENLYKARYMEKIGYVKKSEVTPISGTPQNPYADKINFRIYATNGVNLRSSPESKSPFNILDTIPYLSTNLIYYGKTLGDEAIPMKGNEWYYCKFINGQNVNFGYVYSVFCDNLSEIIPNTEEFEISAPPIFDSDSTETGTPPANMENLSTISQVAIIIGVSLPCLLILYLLFKPNHLISSLKIKKEEVSPISPKKHKIKRKRHADYYEFDDDTL